MKKELQDGRIGQRAAVSSESGLVHGTVTGIFPGFDDVEYIEVTDDSEHLYLRESKKVAILPSWMCSGKGCNHA